MKNHVFYKSESANILLDLTGYIYVLDYFTKLDDLNFEIMAKYRPLPEHYEQSETGNIDYSLDSHLRLHGVHIDLLEKYQQ